MRQQLTAIAAGSVLALPAFAQPHAGDILLEVREGRIATLVDEGGMYVLACTFEGEFGVANQTDEPGFDSEAGAFPSGSSIGFTIRRALREWRGGTFDTIPGERVEISWGPLGPVSTPATDMPVTGFALGVSSNGEFHTHYRFKLASPAEPGVYLLELELWSDRPEIGTSEPVYLVLGQQVDEATLDEAVEWWRANGAWCSATPCVADFNGDGSVNTQDFIAFLNAWVVKDPSADINGDGTVNTSDVVAFLNLWAGGC